MLNICTDWRINEVTNEVFPRFDCFYLKCWLFFISVLVIVMHIAFCECNSYQNQLFTENMNSGTEYELYLNVIKFLLKKITEISKPFWNIIKTITTFSDDVMLLLLHTDWGYMRRYKIWNVKFFSLIPMSFHTTVMWANIIKSFSHSPLGTGKNQYIHYVQLWNVNFWLAFENSLQFTFTWNGINNQSKVLQIYKKSLSFPSD